MKKFKAPNFYGQEGKKFNLPYYINKKSLPYKLSFRGRSEIFDNKPLLNKLLNFLGMNKKENREELIQ